MGVYSTVTITRQVAISRIVTLFDEATDEESADALLSLEQNRLEEATNEQLAEALFSLTENRNLDNYIVVDN